MQRKKVNQSIKTNQVWPVQLIRIHHWRMDQWIGTIQMHS